MNKTTKVVHRKAEMDAKNKKLLLFRGIGEYVDQKHICYKNSSVNRKFYCEIQNDTQKKNNQQKKCNKTSVIQIIQNCENIRQKVEPH